MQKELDAQVRDNLLKTRREWQAIANESGVSYDWIRKFIAGYIPNPGINTLRKLRDHFRAKK